MNIMSLLPFLPLAIFMAYARFNGMTDLVWKNAFIFAGITAVITIAVQMYKKVTFDRLMLGVNLFLIMGSVAFLTNWYGLLSLYGTYKGAALLLCVCLIGLITTLFTTAGFIGIDIAGKAKLKRKYSCFLLLINIVAITWAVMTCQHGLLISAIAPFVAMRCAYEGFGKKLTEKKHE